MRDAGTSVVGYAGGLARIPPPPVNDPTDSMNMVATTDRLFELAEHRRAAPYRVEYHEGLAGIRAGRPYTWFVPPTPEGMRTLFDRVHNGIVLLQPGSVRIHPPAPVAAVAEDLHRLHSTPPPTPAAAEELARLRSIHHVPVLWGEEPGSGIAGRDLPSVDNAQLDAPGEGLALGLDIGGTGMKACALSPRGALLRVASAPTWPDGEEGIESLVRRARALLEQVARGERGGSLGIGLAAPMGVGGRVLELSTVLRRKVGRVEVFDHFAERVAAGLVDGPVSMFNDLINLGRHRSSQGARRLARVQIGTSFGGCWIDSDGAVVATEMARLVIDAAEDGRPHPYLPLRGVARAMLSNLGVATDLRELAGVEVDLREAGLELRRGLEAGQAGAVRVLDRLAASLRAAVGEMAALLPGLHLVEVGGSMLQGPAGPGLADRLAGNTAVPVAVSERPGHDGAVAAARAPRVQAPLRAMRRVG